MAVRILKKTEREPPPEPKRRLRVAGKTPSRDTGVRAEPGRSTGPSRMPPRRAREKGGPGKWIALGIFVAIAAATVLIVYAVKAGRPKRYKPTIPADWKSRNAQDAITASMGGKSMEEWCKEHEKDNDMVQQRRARRKQYTGH